MVFRQNINFQFQKFAHLADNNLYLSGLSGRLLPRNRLEKMAEIFA